MAHTMIPASVLVVDDSPLVRASVAAALRSAGYECLAAPGGLEALRLVEERSPAVGIVDLAMPGMSGTELVGELRRRGRNFPIIILSVASDVESRVRGLESGADDFLTKPFDTRELCLRVAALRRRTAPAQADLGVLALGDTTVDLDKRVARRGNELIDLTRTEVALLVMLARNAGSVVPRERLISDVLGYDESTPTRALETHIWRLRRKLGDGAGGEGRIRNHSGVGYVLEASAPPGA